MVVLWGNLAGCGPFDHVCAIPCTPHSSYPVKRKSVVPSSQKTCDETSLHCLQCHQQNQQWSKTSSIQSQSNQHHLSWNTCSTYLLGAVMYSTYILSVQILSTVWCQKLNIQILPNYGLSQQTMCGPPTTHPDTNTENSKTLGSRQMYSYKDLKVGDHSAMTCVAAQSTLM